MSDFFLNESEHISLCEALDRILNKGAVIVGEVTISVANIDLVYLGLQVVLTSIETARKTASNSDNPTPIRLGLGAGAGLKTIGDW
jgi:gas vesicle structural protein